jgi:sugar/nucleoside kinase (ribokinase family)
MIDETPSLLIVGGLTVDAFADGTRAPGGSVLHSGLAASAAGVRPRILTIAGDEPEATVGLDRLRSIAADVACQTAGATTTFRHTEHEGRRVLVLDALAGPMTTDAPAVDGQTVALVAPIADELSAGGLTALLGRLEPRRAVFLIQGWLRRLEVGVTVHPLALAEVDEALWSAFARADAVVVSTEDLAEHPEDPFAQAAALRARLGPRPILCLTLGAEGYLLDDPAVDRVVASVPRRVVEGVPTVGAGDTFGAAFAIALGDGDGAGRAAERATEAVIGMLEARVP